MNGKGDAYRPVDQKKWSENYDRIFKQHDGTPEQTSDDRQTTCPRCGCSFYNGLCYVCDH